MRNSGKSTIASKTEATAQGLRENKFDNRRKGSAILQRGFASLSRNQAESNRPYGLLQQGLSISEVRCADLDYCAELAAVVALAAVGVAAVPAVLGSIVSTTMTSIVNFSPVAPPGEPPSKSPPPGYAPGELPPAR